MTETQVALSPEQWSEWMLALNNHHANLLALAQKQLDQHVADIRAAHAREMSERDRFAMCALANAYTHHDANPDRIAEWAYQVASMLEARK